MNRFYKTDHRMKLKCLFEQSCCSWVCEGYLTGAFCQQVTNPPQQQEERSKPASWLPTRRTERCIPTDFFLCLFPSTVSCQCGIFFFSLRVLISKLRVSSASYFNPAVSLCWWTYLRTGFSSSDPGSALQRTTRCPPSVPKWPGVISALQAVHTLPLLQLLA